MAFTNAQEQQIAEGAKLTDQLRRIVAKALGAAPSVIESKRHTYIYSPPGVGKTFTVQSTADAHGVKLVKVQGAASLNGFVIAMACAVHAAQGQELVVWIDDCDCLFMDQEALNVMKGALDGERNVVAWGKNLTSQINAFENSELANDRIRGAALRAFQGIGSPGVEIPTDTVRFIVTSNRPLASPSGDLKTAKKMHEAAIRDRVTYVPFDLSDRQSWGWVAHLLLTGNVLRPRPDLHQGQKEHLLKWMHEHFASLPSRSMRQVKDYAAAMVNDPVGYQDQWEVTLMGTRQ